MSEVSATDTKKIFVCPACKQDVYGGISLAIDLPANILDGDKQATFKVTGISIQHNCMPVPTR